MEEQITWELVLLLRLGLLWYYKKSTARGNHSIPWLQYASNCNFEKASYCSCSKGQSLGMKLNSRGLDYYYYYHILPHVVVVAG